METEIIWMSEEIEESHKDDIIFFDEFAVPTHEFKAFYDFLQAYYLDLKLIAAGNNYYFVAFKVV